MKDSAAQRNYVLGLLTLVYAFNFVDRQILGILGPGIIADLEINDSQFGLLTGFVFALFYTVVGLPIAWAADRFNRITIVSISLAVWSGFTALSGFVVSFWQLALARVGVAVGEAGGSPPSHAVLSDLFKDSERGRSLGIYSLGIPFGYMLAFFSTAALAGADSIPWRTTLIVLGIPGVIVAVILKLTVKDPVRGSQEVTKTEPLPFKQALTKLLRIKSYWAMCLGISFASFGGYAIATYSVIYITRAFPEVDVRQILVALGFINGLAYAGGVYVGGYLADRGAGHSVGSYALSPILGLVIGVPAIMLGFLSDSYWFFMAMVSLFVFFTGFYLGPSFSVAQSLAPPEVRATSSAVFFFVLNMIALGGGPTFVGWLSTTLTPSYGALDALRYAQISLIVPYILSVVAFGFAVKWLPGDWRGGAKDTAARKTLRRLKGAYGRASSCRSLRVLRRPSVESFLCWYNIKVPRIG